MMIKDITNNSTPKAGGNLLPLSSPSPAGVTLGDDMITIKQTTKYDDIGTGYTALISLTINGREYEQTFDGYRIYSRDYEVSYKSLESLCHDGIDYNSKYGKILRSLLRQSEYADNFGEKDGSLVVWSE